MTVRYSVVKWLDAVSNPCSLSVSRDGQVLLVDDSGQLSIYTGRGDSDAPDDGELTAVIPLRDIGLDAPWQAVETSAGTWIICHGNEYSQFNGVTELLRDGRQRDSYGSEYGHRPDQLASPWRVALAGMDDNDVFTADTDNNRVVVFARRPSLKLKRVLVSEPSHGEDGWPTCLCYVAASGRLLVGMGWEADNGADGRSTGFLDVYVVR